MNTPAAFFSMLRNASAGGPSMSQRSWTWVGGAAIALWATWPALSVLTRDIPPFECMAMIFFGAWLVTRWLPAFDRSKAEAPRSFWHAWLPAIVFAFGESGSTVFFLFATHRIPTAEANLIVFLWPGITVALGASLGAFRIRAQHVFGIALGFAGVAILMGSALSLSVVGILFALLGSLCWAIYCAFRLVWKTPGGSPLARGFAISTVLCIALHSMIEPSVIPSFTALLATAVIAIVPTGIANVMWDEGLRRGDGRLLAVMAYATPLGSAVLLTGLRLQPLSWRLLIGAVVIVTAGLLSRADEQK